MLKNVFNQIKGDSYVAEGPVNIGIINTEDGVILIDSGNDKEAGRKLFKAVRESGKKVMAVVNTHSNADHIGGNDYLKRNAGAEIWAPKVEAAFTETPFLEPSFLWGGFPFKELRSKFLEAKPSAVDRVLYDGDSFHGCRMIDLPGHFFGQMGLLTGDGVFFPGDSLFGVNIIEKYGLPFIFDVSAFLESIEKIRSTEADFYVPSHGNIVTDINETADSNVKAVSDALNDIRQIIKHSLIFEDILKNFFDLRRLELNHAQYVLVGSTIKSFLSYMHDKGYAEYFFKDNRMYWRAI